MNQVPTGNAAATTPHPHEAQSPSSDFQGALCLLRPPPVHSPLSPVDAAAVAGGIRIPVGCEDGASAAGSGVGRAHVSIGVARQYGRETTPTTLSSHRAVLRRPGDNAGLEVTERGSDRSVTSRPALSPGRRRTEGAAGWTKGSSSRRRLPRHTGVTTRCPWPRSISAQSGVTDQCANRAELSALTARVARLEGELQAVDARQIGRIIESTLMKYIWRGTVTVPREAFLPARAGRPSPVPG